MTMSWEGIEDETPTPKRTWLSQSKESDPWSPLRKCDCEALNTATGNEVWIEFGRATANKSNKSINYNYCKAPSRTLVGAIWFLKESKQGEKENKLTPISANDESVIEELYQLALLSPNDTDLESPLLDDDLYKVYVCKVGDVLSIRRKRKNNFQAVISLEGSFALQRGYGEYSVDGEEEETALGPVSHLSFLIHGIGEAVWSKENTNISGMVDSVDEMRKIIHKNMYDSWQEKCKNLKGGQESPPPPNRIELIPIVWYDEIHSSSSTLKSTLLSTTLKSIPNLRVIANDIVFDVLMYLTPEFCEKVLSFVTDRICELHKLFLTINNDFTVNGGSYSLIGHSLGSVMTWDLLSVLGDKLKSENKDTKRDSELSSVVSSLPKTIISAYQAFASGNIDDDGTIDGTWGPSLTQPMKKKIPFIPKFTFFLGSPLGLFLTLRNARPMFDKIRFSHIEKDSTAGDAVVETSPFTLPSGSVYNIFHPSDPVAYRIEPLLAPPEVSESCMPAPSFLVPGGKGVRLHVKAKAVKNAVMTSLAGMFHKSTDDLSMKLSEDSFEGGAQMRKIASKFKYPLGGNSQGGRVDFQLQPALVDNEYLSAISAHSSYFTNEDVLQFLTECAMDE